jgi:hypothetical protein
MKPCHECPFVELPVLDALHNVDSELQQKRRINGAHRCHMNKKLNCVGHLMCKQLLQSSALGSTLTHDCDRQGEKFPL